MMVNEFDVQYKLLCQINAVRSYAAQIYARRQIVLVDRLKERSVKMQITQIIILVCAGLGMFALLGLVTFLSSHC